MECASPIRIQKILPLKIELRFLITFLLVFFFLIGCGKNVRQVIEGEEEIVETDEEYELEVLEFDKSKLYVPQEHRGNDFDDEASKWTYSRSRQSEHFIVFWEAGFGNNPNSIILPEKMRVDIMDLLEKVEQFYDMNVNTLKFAEVGVGKSNLDRYKIQIYLFYKDEWMAYGSGYDDTIGVLWVSPSTCKPVGATIAHETGHAFQYQVFCDLKDGHGFRYGFGGTGLNGFWEQCAQWQAYQSCPEEVFESAHYGVYCNNYHRHICHENYRYASYFIHYYWAQKHGRDIIGRIWREASQPEDPMEAYMRITGISVDQFNDEIYDAAAHSVTWDIDGLREIGADYIGRQKFDALKLGEGSYLVTYDRCPETTGYNVVRLIVPEAGTVISAHFKGLVNAENYNKVADPGRAGWRYGYVALLKNGSRVYGSMNQGTENNVDFTVPDNCEKLWFVVTGAPNTYAKHPWDDDNSNDDQWPYKLKFNNTDLHGSISFSGNEVPHDTTLTFNLEFDYNASEYTGAKVYVDEQKSKVAYAFVLQPNEITSKLGKSIKWFGLESNGSLNANTTANGFGHWFNANGDVCGWGPDARVASEFDPNNWIFSIVQYPGQCSKGDNYTIKQAMLYESGFSKLARATFVFNITIK